MGEVVKIPLDDGTREIISEEIEKIQGDYYTSEVVDEKLSDTLDAAKEYSDSAIKEVTFETRDTQYQTGVEVPIVSGEHTHYLVDTTELKAHSDSDLSNISILMQNMNSQMSDMRSQILAIQASVSNKTIGSPIDIESSAQGSGYTVNNTLGGQVTFESPLVLLVGVGTLYVNEVSVWTNVGLTIGLGVTGDTIELQDGDLVRCTGMSSIIFKPYIPAT